METDENNRKSDRETIKNALSDKDFLEFLSKLPNQDKIDPDKQETFVEQFKIFQVKKMTFEHLGALYVGKVKIKTGIDLNNDDLGAMNEYLERLAIESPKELLALASKIKKFMELPGRIELRANYISNLGLGSRLRELESLLSKATKYEEDSLSIVDVWKNFSWTKIDPEVSHSIVSEEIANSLATKILIKSYDVLRLAKSLVITPIFKKKTAEQKVAEKALKEKYNLKPEHHERALEQVREKLKHMEEAKTGRDEMRDEFNKLKIEIYGQELAPARIMSEVVKNKINTKLKELLGSSTDPRQVPLENLQSVQKYLDYLYLDKEMSITVDGFGLGHWLEKEDLPQKLDQILEIKITSDLINGVEKLDKAPTETKTESLLSDIEEVLAPFLKIEKLGSKKQVDIRKNLIGKLENIVKLSELSNSKIILLKVIIARLKLLPRDQEDLMKATRAKIEEEFLEKNLMK